MNIATLVQSQTLATLLQALAPAGEIAPGQTIAARLLSIDGKGQATALVGETKIALVLAGPTAREATLQPGATLILRIDEPAQPGAGLRATLLEARAPGAAAPEVDARQAGARPAEDASARPTAATAQATLIRGTPAQVAPAQPGSIQAGSLQASSAQAGPASAAATSPRAAAGPFLGSALARQDSIAPLFANLRAIANGSVALVLPKSLLQAADRVLAQAVPVETRPLTAQALQNAVQQSGLFLEARQAANAPAQAQTQADLKANLVALRDALMPIVEKLTGGPAGKVAGAEAIALALPQDAPPRPAPPQREGALAMQPPSQPTLAAGDGPLVIAETLLEQTESALDRVTLSQFASLPHENLRLEQAQTTRWLTEIPLAFQTGTAMMPLQVEKEPQRKDATGHDGPLWRVRFALDVEPMGPLQGVVTLQGRSVGVTLWAEREETSRLLRGAAPGLEAALGDAQFENGAIEIHTGQPRVQQATAGQFLDRRS